MKKSALLFIENLSFTQDTRVIQEANVLVVAGWDITVISPKFPKDPFYREINENLRAYYYPNITAKSSVDQIIEHSISLILGSLLTFWIFIRHGFTVFHACNPMDILWLVAFPYKILGKKFLFDQHDLSPELYLSRGIKIKENFIYKVLIFLEKISYKFADAVIATNESYKQIAITRGKKDPKDIFIVRNGPDLNKFKKVARRSGFTKKDEILVGYLGNMNPQDGVDYLLKAADNIIKKHARADIKFVFIGGGSSQQSLVTQSRKMGLEDNVNFTGRLFGKELISVLNACDICVQPDPLNPLNDKSTMNKVLEYMALEKPVVAFDLEETRVSCGEAALYVTPNDIDELAKKIIYLANSQKIRFEMGKIGRERIEKMLSWAYSIPNILSAYKHATN